MTGSTLDAAQIDRTLRGEILQSLVLVRARGDSNGPLFLRDMRYAQRVLRTCVGLTAALTTVRSNPGISIPADWEGGGISSNLEVRMPGPASGTSTGVLPRHLGGQPGNTNRIKHGGWSAQAKQRRALLRRHLQRIHRLLASIRAARQDLRVSAGGRANG